MRYIKLTEQLEQQLLTDFMNKIKGNRFSEEKLSFTFDLKQDVKPEDKVNLIIEANAWIKMWGLVSSESGEIGWHMICERINDKTIVIKDVLLYPQYVTGVTVTTDDVGYGDWLHKELDMEEINNLRGHGHSHVNMGTSPSGVDRTWYNEILQSLAEDDYYVFMILNKKDDMFLEIYDLKTNTIYDKKDVNVHILTNNTYLNTWLIEEKRKALQKKEVKVATPSVTTNTSKEKTTVEDILDEIVDVDTLSPGALTELVVMLNRAAIYNNYFDVGSTIWYSLSAQNKVEYAKDYYMNVDTKAVKKNQEKTMYERQLDLWRDGEW